MACQKECTLLRGEALAGEEKKVQAGSGSAPDWQEGPTCRDHASLELRHERPGASEEARASEPRDEDDDCVHVGGNEHHVLLLAGGQVAVEDLDAGACQGRWGQGECSLSFIGRDRRRATHVRAHE
eukprot:542789-Hanusia_phi.AAC.2